MTKTERTQLILNYLNRMPEADDPSKRVVMLRTLLCLNHGLDRNDPFYGAILEYLDQMLIAHALCDAMKTVTNLRAVA